MPGEERRGVAFQRRMTARVSLVSIPCVAIVVLYLVLLLQLPPAHLGGFLKLLGIAVAVLFPTMTWLYQQLYARVARVLDRIEAGLAGPAEQLEAFGRLVALPRQMVVGGLLCWTVGGSLLAGASWLLLDGFPPFSAAVLLGGIVSGGVLSEIFIYLAAKRVAEPEWLAVASEAGLAEDRARAITPLSLGRKLRIAVTGVTLVGVVFGIFFALSLSGRAVEQHATGLQERWLDRVQARLGDTPEPAALARLAEEARLFGVVEHVVVLHADGSVRRGPAELLAAVERQAILASEGRRGDSRAFQSPNTFAWRRLRNGEVLVAATAWESVGGGAGAAPGVLLAVLVAAGLLASLVAWAVSRDVAAAAGRLQQRAEHVAAGDLRPGEIHDGEDELGALGRAFERMEVSLREMVGRIASAGAGVEAAALGIAGAGTDVAGGSQAQAEALEEARGAMGRVEEAVRGIAVSAESLSGAADESAGSVQQVGSLGRELAKMAGGLNERVDEMAGAIEQMARSVTEVARGTDALSGAAADTSGSMEEVAASVRQVETTAGETAKLSDRVVAAAERGQERVQQTALGMEAIRRETETVRSVVEGLNDRAAEIGGILTVIDDVADETNLLALNAAIIAAQSGEGGRAFAVVADQIKDLAERVLSSTREIAQRIGAVQDGTADAARAIVRGVERVAEGVVLSSEAAASLDEITAAARESEGRIDAIAGAVREQAKAAGHVVSLMEQVSAGVARIRSATQEQEHGSERILTGTAAVREAAQLARDHTLEQQRGGERIRENVEGVRLAVGHIHESLQGQARACAEALGLLDRVGEHTRANRESGGRIERAVESLDHEAEALRREVARFRSG